MSILAQATAATAPVLQLRGISKAFPGVQALSGVALNLYPGEVHTLMGQNGAGKSTLIKVLTGVYTPEHGEILLVSSRAGGAHPLRFVLAHDFGAASGCTARWNFETERAHFLRAVLPASSV